VQTLLLTIVLPRPTQSFIPPWSVNEDQLWLRGQRQVWLIPFVYKRVGVQVKLWYSSTTRAIPERFCSEVPSLRGAISTVWPLRFTFFIEILTLTSISGKFVSTVLSTEWYVKLGQLYSLVRKEDPQGQWSNWNGTCIVNYRPDLLLWIGVQMWSGLQMRWPVQTWPVQAGRMLLQAWAVLLIVPPSWSGVQGTLIHQSLWFAVVATPLWHWLATACKFVKLLNWHTRVTTSCVTAGWCWINHALVQVVLMLNACSL